MYIIILEFSMSFEHLNHVYMLYFCKYRSFFPIFFISIANNDRKLYILMIISDSTIKGPLRLVRCDPFMCVYIIRCKPYIYNKVSNYASATSSLILRPITR